MKFEWDKLKDTKNSRKHDISFDEAATVFGDPLAITYPDPDNSEEEYRFLTFGHTLSGNLVVVSHTHRGDRIRPISARKMTRKEIKEYEQI